MTQEARENIAETLGLGIHSKLRELTEIANSGSSRQAYEGISNVDPRMWESLCREVADQILALEGVGEYDNILPTEFVTLLYDSRELTSEEARKLAKNVASQVAGNLFYQGWRHIIKEDKTQVKEEK